MQAMTYIKSRSYLTSQAMKYKNIHKHVGIAMATKNMHESIVHQKIANKFAKRYGVPLPFKNIAE